MFPGKKTLTFPDGNIGRFELGAKRRSPEKKKRQKKKREKKREREEEEREREERREKREERRARCLVAAGSVSWKTAQRTDT